MKAAVPAGESITAGSLRDVFAIGFEENLLGHELTSSQSGQDAYGLAGPGRGLTQRQSLGGLCCLSKEELGWTLCFFERDRHRLARCEMHKDELGRRGRIDCASHVDG